jgi:sulfate adenylyltransferase subunit 2
MAYLLNHLDALESESIHIFREAVACARKPVLMYSVGKDSSVLLRLAQKAFFPGPLPFPLLHVDTGFKFPEMYTFRDEMVARIGARLIVHRNEEAIAKGANPYDLGVGRCCGQLKTGALLQAIEKHGFDCAFGGARREEERSRAKERIFSIRDEFGQWDPKGQRPELWSLYNARVHDGEHMRVFPLSNWTEADIWQYIRKESIPIVPLYFAEPREVVVRGEHVIPAWDKRVLRDGDVVRTEVVRFRTLGCMHCTGAVRSPATTLAEIVDETVAATRSERENRIIDHGSSSMEDKKKEGYF